jgi:hypothetical protein
MAVCAVTLAVNSAAMSGAVKFEALPNQAVGSVMIDTKPVTAEATGMSYIGRLLQGVKYRVISHRFAFHNAVFVCPLASSANLIDLLEGLSGD